MGVCQRLRQREPETDQGQRSNPKGGEERILGGLRSYTAASTTLLISHRVSTVRHADQIAVLNHGKIVELGKHDELLELDGYYASLYQKQQLEEELTVAG